MSQAMKAVQAKVSASQAFGKSGSAAAVAGEKSQAAAKTKVPAPWRVMKKITQRSSATCTVGTDAENG